MEKKKEEKVEKKKLQILQITKSFKRTISDNNYGSVHVGSEITASVEISSTEDLLEANTKLARQARVLSMQDLQVYYDLQKKNKVE